MDKPWLECPSVKEIRDRTHKSPLLWPRKTNINEYRAMLRKGKARPSPGPDRWEKWIVKALPDNVLNAVLTLHNYIVINNRFPGEIRKTIACPIFKKGTITHLTSMLLATGHLTWTLSLKYKSARISVTHWEPIDVLEAVQTCSTACLDLYSSVYQHVFGPNQQRIDHSSGSSCLFGLKQSLMKSYELDRYA